MMYRFFSIAMLAASLAGPAAADQLDPNKGEDAIKIMRKVQCTLNDGEETTYFWTGRVYARVPGVPDLHVFNVDGMNQRACHSVKGADGQTGFVTRTREVMVYKDPKTNEVLRTWDNPWTGKTVDVLHVANDPVNARAPSFPKRADGSEYRVGLKSMAGKSWLAIDVPLFYTNPLAGAYQRYAGNKYHATEMFTFFMDTAEILDPEDDNVEHVSVDWVRIAQWLPWMEMGGRAGLMYTHAAGVKLKGFDDLPEGFKAELRANFAKYETAPPKEDTRPNETSWTYFKKHIDAKRAEQGETGAKGSGH